MTLHYLLCLSVIAVVSTQRYDDEGASLSVENYFTSGEHPSEELHDLSKRKPKSFYAWNGKRGEKRKPKSFYAWNGKRANSAEAAVADEQTDGEKRSVYHWSSRRYGSPHSSGKHRYSGIMSKYYGKRKSDTDEKTGKSFYAWNGKRSYSSNNEHSVKRTPKSFYAWNGKRSQAGQTEQEEEEWGEKKQKAEPFVSWTGDSHASHDQAQQHNPEKKRKKAKSFYAWNGKREDRTMTKEKRSRHQGSFYSWDGSAANYMSKLDIKRNQPENDDYLSTERNGGMTKEDETVMDTQQAQEPEEIPEQDPKRKFYHFSRDAAITY